MSERVEFVRIAKVCRNRSGHMLCNDGDADIVQESGQIALFGQLAGAAFPRTRISRAAVATARLCSAILSRIGNDVLATLAGANALVENTSARIVSTSKRLTACTGFDSRCGEPKKLLRTNCMILAVMPTSLAMISATRCMLDESDFRFRDQRVVVRRQARHAGQPRDDLSALLVVDVLAKPASLRPTRRSRPAVHTAW